MKLNLKDWEEGRVRFVSSDEVVQISREHTLPFNEVYVVVKHPSRGNVCYDWKTGRPYAPQYGAVTKAPHIIEDWRL